MSNGVGRGGGGVAQRLQAALHLPAAPCPFGLKAEGGAGWEEGFMAVAVVVGISGQGGGGARSWAYRPWKFPFVCLSSSQDGRGVRSWSLVLFLGGGALDKWLGFWVLAGGQPQQEAREFHTDKSGGQRAQELRPSAMKTGTQK